MYSHLDIYIIKSQKIQAKKVLRGHLVLFPALRQNQVSIILHRHFATFLKDFYDRDSPSNLCNSLSYLYVILRCLLWISCAASEAHYFLSDTLWVQRTVYFLLWVHGYPVSCNYKCPICLRKYIKEQEKCYKN